MSAPLLRFAHDEQGFGLHHLEVVENLSDLFFLDAEESGHVADGRVVEPGGAARPCPPLRGQGIEEAEGRPVVWPYFAFITVILSRESKSILPLDARLIEGARGAGQFPRRAGENAFW
jgi:hypothetical protein